MCIPLIRAVVYVVVHLMGAFKNIQSFQISATNPADPAAVRGNFQNPICDRAGAQILARDWEGAQQRVDDGARKRIVLLGLFLMGRRCVCCAAPCWSKGEPTTAAHVPVLKLEWFRWRHVGQTLQRNVWMK